MTLPWFRERYARSQSRLYVAVEHDVAYITDLFLIKQGRDSDVGYESSQCALQDTNLEMRDVAPTQSSIGASWPLSQGGAQAAATSGQGAQQQHPAGKTMETFQYDRYSLV